MTNRVNSLNDFIDESYFRYEYNQISDTYRKIYFCQEIVRNANTDVKYWSSLYPKISPVAIADYIGVLYGARPVCHFFRVFNRHFYEKISGKIWRLIDKGYEQSLRRDNFDDIVYDAEAAAMAFREGEFSLNVAHYIFPIPEQLLSVLYGATVLETVSLGMDNFLFIRKLPLTGLCCFDENKTEIGLRFHAPSKFVPAAISVINKLQKMYPQWKTEDIEFLVVNSKGEFEIRFYNVIITNVSRYLEMYPAICENIIVLHSRTFNIRWSGHTSVVYFEYLLEKALFHEFKFHRRIQMFFCYHRYHQGLLLFDYLTQDLVKITVLGEASKYEDKVIEALTRIRGIYETNDYKDNLKAIGKVYEKYRKRKRVVREKLAASRDAGRSRDDGSHQNTQEVRHTEGNRGKIGNKRVYRKRIEEQVPRSMENNLNKCTENSPKESPNFQDKLSYSVDNSRMNTSGYFQDKHPTFWDKSSYSMENSMVNIDGSFQDENPTSRNESSYSTHDDGIEVTGYVQDESSFFGNDDWHAKNESMLNENPLIPDALLGVAGSSTNAAMHFLQDVLPNFQDAVSCAVDSYAGLNKMHLQDAEPTFQDTSSCELKNNEISKAKRESRTSHGVNLQEALSPRGDYSRTTDVGQLQDELLDKSGDSKKRPKNGGKMDLDFKHFLDIWNTLKSTNIPTFVDLGSTYLNRKCIFTLKKTKSRRKLKQREIRLCLYSSAYNIRNPLTIHKMRVMKLADIYPTLDREFLAGVTLNNKFKNCFKKRVNKDDLTVCTYSRCAQIEPQIVDNMVLPVCTAAVRNEVSSRSWYNFFKMSIQAEDCKYDVETVPGLYKLVMRPYLVETSATKDDLGCFLMRYRLLYPNNLLVVYAWTDNYVALDNIACAHCNARVIGCWRSMTSVFAHETDGGNKIRITDPDITLMVDETKALVVACCEGIAYNGDCSYIFDMSVYDGGKLFVYAGNIYSKFYGMSFYLAQDAGRRICMQVVQDEGVTYVVRDTPECEECEIYYRNEANVGVEEIEEFYRIVGDFKGTVGFVGRLCEECDKASSIICILGQSCSKYFCDLVLKKYSSACKRTSSKAYPHRIFGGEHVAKDINADEGIASYDDYPLLLIDKESCLRVFMYCIKYSELSNACWMLLKKHGWEDLSGAAEVAQMLRTYNGYKFVWSGFHNQIVNSNEDRSCTMSISKNLRKIMMAAKVYQGLHRDVSKASKITDIYERSTFEKCMYEDTKRILDGFQPKTSSVGSNVARMMQHCEEFRDSVLFRVRLSTLYDIWNAEVAKYDMLALTRETTEKHFRSFRRHFKEDTRKRKRRSKMPTKAAKVSRPDSSGFEGELSRMDLLKKNLENVSYLSQSAREFLLSDENLWLLDEDQFAAGETTEMSSSHNDLPSMNSFGRYLNSGGKNNEANLNLSRTVAYASCCNPDNACRNNILFALKNLRFVYHPVLEDQIVRYVNGNFTPFTNSEISEDLAVSFKSGDVFQEGGIERDAGYTENDDDNLDPNGNQSYIRFQADGNIYGNTSIKTVSYDSTRPRRSGLYNLYRFFVRNKSDVYIVHSTSFPYNVQNNDSL